MIIEYVIITALSLALLWQTWRKRVWRDRSKRANAFADAVERQFYNLSDKFMAYLDRQQAKIAPNEWPELINEKTTNNEKSS